MDNLFLIIYHCSFIAIIFLVLIAIGCFISPNFKKEFLDDWNRG